MPPAEQVPPAFAAQHLAKAAQFAAAAQQSAAGELWDAAVSAASLAGIAAADAYMVGIHGVRNRGDHRAGIKLLRAHGGPPVAPQAEALARLVARKSSAQYGERLSTAREARDAIARAERLIEWAREALKGASK